MDYNSVKNNSSEQYEATQQENQQLSDEHQRHSSKACFVNIYCFLWGNTDIYNLLQNI